MLFLKSCASSTEPTDHTTLHHTASHQIPKVAEMKLTYDFSKITSDPTLNAAWEAVKDYRKTALGNKSVGTVKDKNKFL